MKSLWKVGAWFSVLFLWCVPALFARTWPDTGQTKCYDNTAAIPCPAPGQPFYGQDAQYQGLARSYTKLGQNGAIPGDWATQESGWLMTRDNVTGLIWEMKTEDGGIHNFQGNVRFRVINDISELIFQGDEIKLLPKNTLQIDTYCRMNSLALTKLSVLYQISWIRLLYPVRCHA